MSSSEGENDDGGFVKIPMARTTTFTLASQGAHTAWRRKFKDVWEEYSEMRRNTNVCCLNACWARLVVNKLKREYFVFLTALSKQMKRTRVRLGCSW